MKNRSGRKARSSQGRKKSKGKEREKIKKEAGCLACTFMKGNSKGGTPLMPLSPLHSAN